MKARGLLVFGVIVFGLLPVLLTVKPVKAAAASYYFSPSTIKLNVGQSTTVSLFLSTDTAINAGDGTIVLPTSYVSGSSISKSGSIFANWPEEPGISGASIRFAGGLPTPGYQGTSGRVLSVTLRGVAEGTGLITISGGRILANNSGSTNIFSGASSATVTVTRVVTGAAITSTTHPDPAKWYKAKDTSLTWTKPAGAASYSYTLSHDDDQPSKSGSGTATSANFSELADGIWTFSLVTTFSDGKTASSSYTIRVDTTPPAKFEFTTERKNGSTDPFPIISFTTTDTPSGIERYEVIVDSNEPISTTENTIKLPKQRPGKHTLIVRAIDKAGNSTDSVGSFNVDGFAGPIITDYPLIVSIFQKIKLTGKALYGAKVQLYIGGIVVEEFIVKDHLSDSQKESPEIATVTDDSTVEWTYEMKNGQLPGYRLLYATQTKPDGAESNLSNQIKFLVAPDSVNVFGFNIPLLLIVFLLLVVLMLSGAFIVIGYRRVKGIVIKRRKNNEELERMVKEKMDGLQHDLEHRVSPTTKNPGKIIKNEINIVEDEIIEEIEKSG